MSNSLSLDDLPDERWININGFEALYQVSTYARIKSKKNKHCNNQFSNEQILKQYKRNHYMFVVLCKNGKKYRKNVHRLVAENFIPNPNNLPLVLHKKAISDGGNNNIDNLYWGTQKDNMNDRRKDGHSIVTEKTRKKISNARSIPVCQFTKDGLFVKAYKSALEVEKETGIKNNHIGTCCKGKRKTAGGYVWKYYEEVRNE